MKDFALLETIRISADGVAYLLDRHLNRLHGSARFFGFNCEIRNVAESVARAIPPHAKPARLRLLLSREGEYDLEFSPLPSSEFPRRLYLSQIRLDSKDMFLRHKTTNRKIYEEARRGFEADEDALLINEHGQATETTIANIAIRRGTQWITPPVSCGLLPGTMRAELLAEGQIVEGVIFESDLIDVETIRCFNSVRGIFDLPLLIPRAF